MATEKISKSEQNARAYQNRKLREHLAERCNVSLGFAMNVLRSHDNDLERAAQWIADYQAEPM